MKSKSELLNVKTKDFQHNVDNLNKKLLCKEKKIACSGEENLGVIFQLFNAHESCPTSKFQEVIGETLIKNNRRPPQIAKEHLMD